MYQSYLSSNLLFHFTKKFDTVISIIKNGFYPMTAIEDISFMLPNAPVARVGIPMVCFTDIPIELTEEHRKEYGMYGLGLKKEWGINNGLNPICYMIKDSEIYNAYNHLQWVISQQALKLDDLENKNQENVLETMDAVMNFAGYLKEYSKNPVENIKPYYDEREWRYLPPFKDEGENINGHCNRLNIDDINEMEKEKLNKHMRELYTLHFTIEDLEKIIIPKDEDITVLIRMLYESSLVNPEIYINKIVQL